MSTAIRPKTFAHVVYRTDRFKEMLDWYESSVFNGKVHESHHRGSSRTYRHEVILPGHGEPFRSRRFFNQSSGSGKFARTRAWYTAPPSKASGTS